MTNRTSFLAPTIIAAVFIGVACVYWPTASYLLGFGRDFDHGTHAALVILIVFYLIWNRRHDLSKLPIYPFLPGFGALIVLGFLWLAGQLVFTRVFTQFAMLAMVPAVVLTLLGFRWVATLAFPFFLLMFALPVWSPLVPTLVNLSAKFAEMGIRASGVPMYRDGAYFVVPTGSWSIADTCSGVAFLSTCLLLGVLYAWTIYKSPLKRILFIIGAGIIGVVGNWIRVYLTIMIAHLTDNRLLRDDHYTFGWLLFAVFLFLFCWFGWRYRDTEQQEVVINQSKQDVYAATSPVPGDFSVSRLFATSVVILAAIAAWPIIGARLLVASAPGAIDIADISLQNGWSNVAKPSVKWVPEISNPAKVRVQSFEKNGQHVDVFVGVYQNETWDSKLVTVSNQLARVENSEWTLANRGSAVTSLSDMPLEVKTGIVLGGKSRILAWHWYSIHGVFTGNDLRAKFQQLITRLQGKGATSAWVTIYTVANVSTDASEKLLQDFMREMGGSLQNTFVTTGVR